MAPAGWDLAAGHQEGLPTPWAVSWWDWGGLGKAEGLGSSLGWSHRCATPDLSHSSCKPVPKILPVSAAAAVAPGAAVSSCLVHGAGHIPEEVALGDIPASKQ